MSKEQYYIRENPDGEIIVYAAMWNDVVVPRRRQLAVKNNTTGKWRPWAGDDVEKFIKEQLTPRESENIDDLYADSFISLDNPHMKLWVEVDDFFFEVTGLNTSDFEINRMLHKMPHSGAICTDQFSKITVIAKSKPNDSVARQ